MQTIQSISNTYICTFIMLLQQNIQEPTSANISFILKNIHTYSGMHFLKKRRYEVVPRRFDLKLPRHLRRCWKSLSLHNHNIFMLWLSVRVVFVKADNLDICETIPNAEDWQLTYRFMCAARCLLPLAPKIHTWRKTFACTIGTRRLYTYR